MNHLAASPSRSVWDGRDRCRVKKNASQIWTERPRPVRNRRLGAATKVARFAPSAIYFSPSVQRRYATLFTLIIVRLDDCHA